MNDARSNYNSLQTTLTERLSHGFSFTAGYTYGHGLDNGSLNRFGNLPQNSLNPGLEYGNSDFDIRHRFTFTASYDIPGKKGFGQLLEGWKLNTIVSLAERPAVARGRHMATISAGTAETSPIAGISSGTPATSSPARIPFPTARAPAASAVALEPAASTGSIRELTGTPLPRFPAPLWNAVHSRSPPTRVRSPPAAATCPADRSWFLPTLGTFGTMGRNIFRDTGFKNVDFSVFKNFTFKERYSAQFRVEFFNVFNHPIIANPYGAANGVNCRQRPLGRQHVRLRVRHTRRRGRQSAGRFGKQPRDSSSG